MKLTQSLSESFVLQPKGEEGIVIGFMMFATWPIALLLLVLGLVMLGRR
ncbi:MAG: hypothetical protein HYV62_05870 [Candidatus Rokubacteria bacterium]|nr:hypothetical protein [Candidatus Rokubacteria bacterium]